MKCNQSEFRRSLLNTLCVFYRIGFVFVEMISRVMHNYILIDMKKWQQKI